MTNCVATDVPGARLVGPGAELAGERERILAAHAVDLAAAPGQVHDVDHVVQDARPLDGSPAVEALAT